MSEEQNVPKFASLKSVPLREGWQHEAKDFTPWLSQNLQLVGEAIEMQLELVAVEQKVGIFSADILCKTPESDHFVLIENQVERTDHKHLGQVLTYAAGLDAVTIVWVAAAFADEHRACLDWLNRSTREGMNFFGIEVELWKIGDSPYAPKLKVVSRPNSWTKQVTTASDSLAESATKQTQLRYWTAFAETLQLRQGPLKPVKPFADNWMPFSPFNTQGIGINTYTKRRPTTLGVSMGFNGTTAPARLELLREKQEEIEEELGQLKWHVSQGRMTAYCALERYDLDPMEEDTWKDQHDWLIVHAERFYHRFKAWILELRSVS
ncbi:MAG: DUF4268 domain-containing protein [Fimbriimonadaceae bacterium]